MNGPNGIGTSRRCRRNAIRLPPTRAPISDDSRMFGNSATGNPLARLLGHVMECEADDGSAGGDALQQFSLSAKQRQQSGSNQRFSNGTGGQGAAGFFHQQRGIQQAETKATRFFRDANGECAEFGQAIPHRLVETRGHGGADAYGAALLVEEAREGLAHHFLFFGQIEIHAAATPFAK